METRGQRGGRIVPPRRGQQCDAHRQAVAPLAGGHGDAAEVEEVHEVGVGPEPAVGGDRIGEHLVDGDSAVGAVGTQIMSTEAMTGASFAFSACSA